MTLYKNSKGRQWPGRAGPKAPWPFRPNRTRRDPILTSTLFSTQLPLMSPSTSGTLLQPFYHFFQSFSLFTDDPACLGFSSSHFNSQFDVTFQRNTLCLASPQQIPPLSPNIFSHRTLLFLFTASISFDSYINTCLFISRHLHCTVRAVRIREDVASQFGSVL